MEETTQPPVVEKTPSPKSSKFNIWKIITLLLIAVVLIGGGYFLAMRNGSQVYAPTPAPQASVTPSQVNASPSVLPSASPTATPVSGKIVSAGANIGAFFPYKIQVPDGWSSDHSGDGANIDKLIISKGNYSITIQQAGGGAGSCIYPGDPAAPMAQSFTKFVDFQSIDTDFRRSGDNQGQLWTLCEKKPAGFQFPTTYGYISYASSGVVDPAVFTQMDSIVASITKQ